MPATPFRTRERQQQMLALVRLFEQLPFLLLASRMREEYGRSQGRMPHMDDVCARCDFELGSANATRTICYLVLSETTTRVVEAKKRTILREKTVPVYHIVHHCPRHGCEVEPLSKGEYTGGNTAIRLQLLSALHTSSIVHHAVYAT